MPTFILDDADGIGSDDLDPFQAFIDMVIIANDDGVGLDDPVGGMQRVTYNRTENGAPQMRLDALVNTAFTPDYGAGPVNVDIIVIAGLSGFVLDDGTSFANNGTALSPASSGLGGSSLNTTENCLVIYDTQQTICVARNGTGGDLDLPISNPVVLYHEFSHAFRIVRNELLALGGGCDPSSPEENAAITDENDLRTQLANRQNATPELRDPGIHCGRVDQDCSSCCIIASAVSGSMNSPQVQFLRSMRDYFVRGTEIGYAFFERFFRDYYSFSPQVCTIMARNPDIPRRLLEGYINPLLDFWKVMTERFEKRLNAADLGLAFARLYPDREKARRRLAALRKTAAYWVNHDSRSCDIPVELIELLRERAFPSDHIQWALVTPVRIHHDLLTLLIDGASETDIGRAFNRALESWAPELPISDLWASLPAEQVIRELGFCHDALLHSQTSKNRFHQRLRERFSDITSIDHVLNGMAGTTGDAQ